MESQPQEVVPDITVTWIEDKGEESQDCQDDVFGGTADVDLELNEVETESLVSCPCISCGSNCFIKLEIEGNEESTPTVSANTEDDYDNERELFSNLCQFLKIKKKKLIRTFYSSWKSRNEKIPICSMCRSRITLLNEMQQKVKLLEEDFQNAVKIFANLFVSSESTFEESEIYIRDKRYFSIRKPVVRKYRLAELARNKKQVADKTVVKINDDVGVSSRRSIRQSKSTNSASLPTDSLPVPISVDVSMNKKLNLEVKTEVFSDTEDGCVTEEFPGISLIFDEEQILSESVNCKETPTDTILYEPLSKRKGLVRKEVAHKITKIPKLKKKFKAKQKLVVKENFKKNRRERKPKVREPSPLIFIETSDSESEERKNKRPSKRKLKPKDPDFCYYSQDEYDSDEDRWDEGEKVRREKKSGCSAFLHVKFEPLNNDGDRYRCLDCEETVAKSMFRKHVFKYHTSKYKCKECGRCHSSSLDLDKHIRYSHRNERQECPICGKPCSNLNNRMQNHISTHYSKEERLEAARSGKLRMWSDLRNIQCDLCGKKFSSKYDLERHNLSKHTEDATLNLQNMHKELCPDCGKLISKSYLKLHRLRTHNVSIDANLSVGTKMAQEPKANRHFICTLCDRRFFKSMELVRHKMSVHEQNYPFKCELCTRSFLLKRQLDRHMNTHNNIRPFPCPHCPMAFFSNGNRTRHVSTYHVEGANPRRKTYVRGMLTKDCYTKLHQPQAQTQSSLEPIKPDLASVIAHSSSSETVILKKDTNISVSENANAPLLSPEENLLCTKPLLVCVQDPAFLQDFIFSQTQAPSSSISVSVTHSSIGNSDMKD